MKRKIYECSFAKMSERSDEPEVKRIRAHAQQRKERHEDENREIKKDAQVTKPLVTGKVELGYRVQVPAQSAAFIFTQVINQTLFLPAM